MSNEALIIFNAVDTDGDGVLTQLELTTRLSDFGMSDAQVSLSPTALTATIWGSVVAWGGKGRAVRLGRADRESPFDCRSTSCSRYLTRTVMASSASRSSSMASSNLWEG